MRIDKSEAMEYAYFESPVGNLLIAGSREAVKLISFPEGSKSRKPQPGWVQADKPFAEVARQLRAYFSRDLRRFDLPLQPEGTAFQLAVWRRLQEIPYGETVTYGELARRLGNPQGARAVGMANGSNPLPIVIPCHRVIASNGRLTGFGGGLEVKQMLLDIEKGLPPLI
jgi:methylated-DNA-[protein]-cysteine S-methyltransferase